MTKCNALRAALAAAGVFLAAAGADARSADGKRVYIDANCVGCHKWHGQGGGGYGGAALSLRETFLEREDLIEAVRCGRPETRMPYHGRFAWKKSAPCWDETFETMGVSAPAYFLAKRSHSRASAPQKAMHSASVGSALPC